jgi:putative phosphoesterase
MTVLIGVISDTHGVVRPEAMECLRGVERILHAGDVGARDVLTALARIAPVTAVRGNVDRGALARLPAARRLEIAGHSLYMLHDVDALRLDPAAACLSAVISGHAHRPSVRWEGGVLYLNPGSAGPRRFGLPLSLARLTITGARLEPEIVELAG